MILVYNINIIQSFKIIIINKKDHEYKNLFLHLKP